jgi:hypothetical protein
MSPEEKGFAALGAAFPEAEPGKLFGKPCFKTGGKAFLCFFRGCAVFKLPLTEREEALSKVDAVLFDPSGKGRPMKEWVQLPFAGIADWHRFAAAAFGYVAASAA